MDIGGMKWKGGGGGGGANHGDSDDDVDNTRCLWNQITGHQTLGLNIFSLNPPDNFMSEVLCPLLRGEETGAHGGECFAQSS